MTFEQALEAMRQGAEVAVEKNCTDIMALKIKDGEIVEFYNGRWESAGFIQADLIMNNDWWVRR